MTCRKIASVAFSYSTVPKEKTLREPAAAPVFRRDTKVAPVVGLIAIVSSEPALRSLTKSVAARWQSPPYLPRSSRHKLMNRCSKRSNAILSSLSTLSHRAASCALLALSRLWTRALHYWSHLRSRRTHDVTLDAWPIEG